MTLLSATLVQSTVLPSGGILGMRPDIVLVLVVLWSSLSPMPQALLWGLLGGACIDLFSAGPFGVSMLALGVTAVLSAALGEYLRHVSGALVLLLPPLGTVIADLLMLVAMSTVGWPIDLPSTVALVILPSVVSNTVIGPLVYIYVRLGIAWLTVRPRVGAY